MAKMAIFFAILAISPWRKSRKKYKWRMAMSPPPAIDPPTWYFDSEKSQAHEFEMLSTKYIILWHSTTVQYTWFGKLGMAECWIRNLPELRSRAVSGYFCSGPIRFVLSPILAGTGLLQKATFFILNRSVIVISFKSRWLNGGDNSTLIWILITSEARWNLHLGTLIIRNFEKMQSWELKVKVKSEHFTHLGAQ